jgi:hypothetical protein
MVMNRLQDGLPNSRIAPRAPRLNCQKKLSQMGTHTFFFSNSDRDFHSENNNVSLAYPHIKKITLTFEKNDEHQARSHQNALRYGVITKLS